MGGKAFDNTLRLSQNEYLRIKTMVKHHLISLGLNVAIPAEYVDKLSFGDVDIYVSKPLNSEIDKSLILNSVCECIESTEKPYINKDFTSFLTKERYQVDIVFVPEHLINISSAVESNGDFIWLIQKSLETVDLLLTVHGLFIRQCKFTVLSKQEACFLLSLEPAKIAEFIGKFSYLYPFSST